MFLRYSYPLFSQCLKIRRDCYYALYLCIYFYKPLLVMICIQDGLPRQCSKNYVHGGIEMVFTSKFIYCKNSHIKSKRVLHFVEVYVFQINFSYLPICVQHRFDTIMYINAYNIYNINTE